MFSELPNWSGGSEHSWGSLGNFFLNKLILNYSEPILKPKKLNLKVNIRQVMRYCLESLEEGSLVKISRTHTFHIFILFVYFPYKNQGMFFFQIILLLNKCFQDLNSVHQHLFHLPSSSVKFKYVLSWQNNYFLLKNSLSFFCEVVPIFAVLFYFRLHSSRVLSTCNISYCIECIFYF